MHPQAVIPALALLLLPAFASAQQYDLRTFSLEQGLPSASVSALCEDADGYLWVATDEGAARSDGLRFEVVDRQRGLPCDDMTALHADASGAVWLGCRNGAVTRWTGDSIAVFTLPTDMEKASVRGFATNERGALLIATLGNGVLYADEQGMLPHGLAGQRVNALAQVPGRGTLAATDLGLYLNNGREWQRMELPLPDVRTSALHVDSRGVLVATLGGYLELDTALRPLPVAKRFTGHFPISLPDARILAIMRARNGDIWMGTPAGLVHLGRRGGQPHLTVMGEANGLGHELVRCVIQDRSGAIWAGTGFGGASKFVSDATLHFTDRDGLRSRIVSSIHRTPDGLLWMATVGGGISRWDDRKLAHWGHAEGLSDPFVLTLSDDRSGHLLAGTATEGLFRMGSGRFQHLSPPFAPTSDRILALRRDGKDRIWAGTANGLFVDEGDGRYTLVGESVLMVNDVRPMEDTVWLATDRGLYHVTRRNERWTMVRDPRLPTLPLNALEYDVGGNLWLGTGGHGLYRLKGDQLDSIGVEEGLASRSVEFILLDAYQNVWVGTRRSLHHMELDVLQEDVIAIHHFGPREGFAGIEAFRNACFLDRDSALWFGSVRGATRYDPRRVQEDPKEPLVHITDLQLFFERPDWRPWCSTIGKAGLPMGLRLPYDQNHLTFSFTGISLAHPERVRYRFILEGYDPDWSPITALDRVTYSNIPPGEHTFRVMARNGSGVWNEEPLSYTFTITPPFWATLPFRTGVGGALLLILFGTVRYRERRLRKDHERLENMVAKRTHELATEKDHSERLLLNILPATTAEELKTKGTAEARRYESATVLFSDFKGFTGFSSLMDSAELVAELDHFFRLFDRLCDQYGLEKIKTIGDAYMCAAGIPEPQEEHALRAVLMALGMIDAVERANADRCARGLVEWPIRIGLHSGPLVTGVVGEKKFAYDIWGDTVNLASRMESNSEAGQVNISGTTYALVMDYVDVEPRGPIKAKGKGEVHMYFVTGLKPRFATDKARRLPNEALLQALGRVEG